MVLGSFDDSSKSSLWEIEIKPLEHTDARPRIHIRLNMFKEKCKSAHRSRVLSCGAVLLVYGSIKRSIPFDVTFQSLSLTIENGARISSR